MTTSVVKLFKNSPSVPSNQLLSAALNYADEGHKVFPVKPNEKRPAVKNGLLAATDNHEQIKAWWSSMPDANIGIATGPTSGFWVLDLDEKNGVSGSTSILGYDTDDAAPTLTAITGSGGSHRLYQYPSDIEIKTRAGILPGVDVRGQGGYIVAAPSIVDGKLYRWLNDAVPIASAPQTIIDLVTRPLALKPSSGVSAATEVLIAEGGRNDKLMRYAMTQLRRGYSHDEVSELVHTANQQMCTPPLPTDEVSALVKNVISSFQSNMQWHCSDMGNAGKMAEQFADTLRYVRETDRWLIWSGVYWKTVSETQVEGLAKKTVRSLHYEADGLQAGPMKEALKKHALRSESAKSIVDMIRLLKSEASVAISISDLDKRPYLLPVLNGVIDLETGEFLPPDPALLITQTAGVVYDPNAKCPRWLAFLLQIMGGDMNMVTYLRDAIGYTLTSSISEQCLFFAYGFGANGKSTFLNIIRALLGDLGIQASANTLLDTGSKSGNAPSSDLARLIGKRFIAISEVDDGKFFAEGLIKSFTGGEPIVARPLYRAPIEFTPSGKVWFAGNHKPTIKGTDDGIWRRTRFLHFEVKIAKSDQDPLLEQKLREELPGILNWAIEGCLAWIQNGRRLKTPAKVVKATDEYRSEMDVVGSWISEFCIEGPGLELNFDTAYRLFEPWCRENYNWSWSKKKLGQRFLERSYEPELKKGSRIYRGIGLRSDLPDSVIQSYLNRTKFNSVFGSENKHRKATDGIEAFVKDKKSSAAHALGKPDVASQMDDDE